MKILAKFDVTGEADLEMRTYLIDYKQIPKNSDVFYSDLIKVRPLWMKWQLTRK